MKIELRPFFENIRREGISSEAIVQYKEVLIWTKADGTKQYQRRILIDLWIFTVTFHWHRENIK